VTRRGDRVVFQISDAYLPEPKDLLTALTDEVELEGTVADFSDAGASARAFALVRLYSSQTVVVPVDRLRVVTLGSSELKGEF